MRRGRADKRGLTKPPPGVLQKQTTNDDKVIPKRSNETKIHLCIKCRYKSSGQEGGVNGKRKEDGGGYSKGGPREWER